MHPQWLIVVRRIMVSGLLLMLALAGIAPDARAASFIRVTPTGASTWPCGDTWATACDLQTALTNAASGDEIWVAAGTYTPTSAADRTASFQLKSGVAIYGGFVMTETLRDQRDWATSVVTLSGDLLGNDGPNFANNSENSYHVVTGATGATLDGVTITGGNANGASPNFNGGGMINNNSSPTLTHVIFQSNTASNAGGGLDNFGSHPTLTHVTFSGNIARFGGGVDNFFSNPTLVNITFAGNGAAQYGGGIYNEVSRPTLTHVTFSGNMAASGGALYNALSSQAQVANSILWGDSGGEVFNSTGVTLTLSTSVVQGGCPAGNSYCSGLITNNPLLGILGEYGGGLPTLPLLPGSPAIGVTNANCPTADARGVPRPQGSACDLGAFESRTFTFAPGGGDNQTTAIYRNFSQPLSVTVSSVYSDPVDGGQVLFRSPISGPGLTSLVYTTTIASGVASQIVMANGSVGSYVVTVSAVGATTGSGSATIPFTMTNVDNPVLHVIPGGLSDGWCDTWITACELRYALSSSGAGQEIWVAAGTYTPADFTPRTATFQLKAGVAIYGGFAATETLRDQRNWVAHVVTLSGDLFGNDGPNFANNSENSYHVVTGATDATLDGVTIAGGNANASVNPDWNGGGMINNSSSPTLTHVIFRGNASANVGGGMLNSISSPRLTDVLFIGNSGRNYGGGMYNAFNSNLVLINVTFFGNHASQWGGGYYGGGLYNEGSSPTLNHVTLSGNSGGGISNYYSHPQIVNSILWGDSGSEIYNDTGGGATISASVVQGGCSAGSTCSNLITDDPLLGALGNYGDGLPTLPLLPGSSAIDATNANCPGTDARGVTRPQVNACDLGAFESQGFTLAKTGGDGQSTPTNLDFLQPLSVTVTSVYSEPVNGGQVRLSAPSSGASLSTTAFTLTIASGVFSTNVTANGIVGTYPVTASAAGAVSVTFALTNTVTPIRYAVPGGLNSGPCDSWITACELRYALSTSGVGNEIWIKEGTYIPTTGADRTATFQLKAGLAIYGGFGGNETTRNQRDWVTHVVTLSGDLLGNDGPNFVNNGENSYHVVTGATGAILDGVTISSGNANGSSPHDGGGGLLNSGSSPTLTHIILRGNAASQAGGGLFSSGSSPALSNLTFISNTAQTGGGMFNESSDPILSNVTFAGNTAVNGGAVYSTIASRPTLTHVTISGNTASSGNGGGLYNADSAHPQIINSIVWGDGGSEVYNDTTTAASVAITASVVRDGCPAGSSDCSGLIANDPLLSLLGDYGGGLPTLPLLPGSSAIDATNVDCPATDERGVTRPQGNACDLGAFESRGFILTKAGGDNQAVPIDAALPLPLNVTLREAGGSGLPGAIITFTAPAIGASIVPPLVVTRVTDAAGVASFTAIANGIAGAYSITAKTANLVSVTFVLTNFPVIRAVPGGLNSGLCDSWTNACELRYALSQASSGQEIWVAAGTYIPTASADRAATFQLKAGVDIYGGFAATETLRDQRNWATNVVTLSGDLLGNDGPNFANMADNSYHVVSGTTGATLDGVSIVGGNANGSGFNGGGGGMFNYSSNPTLVNVTFTGNAAVLGGGLISYLGSATLDNVTFNGNSATQYGGGMLNYSSMATVTNAAFSGNISAQYGGGMTNYSGLLTMTNATFNGNTSTQYGGGVFNYYGILTISNATFFSNTSTSLGGGIANLSSNLMLSHVTVSANTAITGGALFNSGNAQVVNSVLWGDSGGEVYNNLPSTAIITNSTVQGGCSTGSTCSDLITIAPQFGVFGDHGGTLLTLPLLPGSPAIDAGNPGYCAATDQRGQARDDLHCDSGAYELKYPDSPTVIRSASSTTLTTFGPALIGIQRDAVADPGVITVTKSLTWKTKPANTIDAYWLITPTIDNGLNLTLTLCYPTTESNGLSLDALRFWKFSAGMWMIVGGTPITSTVGLNSCATISGVNELSVWTLGSSNQPSSVSMQSLTARPEVSPVAGLLLLVWLVVVGGFIVTRRGQAH